MLHMEDSVVVSVRIEQAFDFVADFRNTAQWHRNMKQVGYKTDEPPRLGSEYDWIETFMGKTMDLSGVITAWDPPNGFTWQPIDGPYTMSGGWTFESDGSQTKVTRFSDTELFGVMRIAATLMTSIAKRQVRADLEKLKGLMELSASQ